MSRKLSKYLAMAVFVSSLGIISVQADPIVDAKTRLAITGDSITEQKMYSRFIELYLTACAPQQPEAIFQFGWSGDRAPGFAGRMVHDCLSFFKPTLMTTCYGMNDGNYRAFDEATRKPYTEGMAKLIKQAADAKVTVLVGGPGAVDAKTYRNADTAKMYNDTLSKLSKIAQELAKQNNMPFADVHKTCMDAMTKAKADLGDAYVVMGRDGVHPGENGQLAMAFAFLKEMGFDGNIGSITVNMAASGNDRVAVTGEHDAKVAEDGSLKITSRRWPFCFTGGAKDWTTLAMSHYLPFNETLNRFTLTVKGLNTPFADVSWGGNQKRFTREELEKGINLAEVFAGITPFQSAWGKLNSAVLQKQELETFMIKSIRANMRAGFVADAGMKDDFNTFWNALLEKGWADKNKAVQAAFQPVNHTITVKAVTGEPVVVKSDISTVPEAAQYRLIYDLDLNKLKGDSTAYTTDVSRDAGEFSRVAYFLELGEGETPTQWIWVSMDAFTKDAAMIGVPSHMLGTLFHQGVKNMTVQSTVESIKNGSGFDGWVEFWPSNYTQKNSQNVPNASDTTFDWGDTPAAATGAGYGSMQVHNPGEKQVLFALNNWRANGPDKMDLGIGNQPQGNPDYTFSNNSGKYKFKRLQVLVK